MHHRQLQQLQPRLRPPGVRRVAPRRRRSHDALKTLSSGMIGGMSPY